MPPKKKKGKGKKKKKDDATLELDDKYKRTMMEIEALKDNLAIRKELSRRNQMTSDTMKSRMTNIETELEKQKQDQQDINAAMTQQYKKMQTDKNFRIHYLERELMQTQKQLRDTEKKLRETEEEKERIIKEKDTEIENLQHSMFTLERDYKRILDDALRKLIEKLDVAKEKWEEGATSIQTKNKHMLMELRMTDPWLFDEVQPMKALHF